MLTSLSRIGSATPKPLKSNEIRFCRASQLMPRADANIQLQRSRVWEGMVVQEVDNSGDRSSSRLGSVEGLHGIMSGSSRPASAAGS